MQSRQARVARAELFVPEMRAYRLMMQSGMPRCAAVDIEANSVRLAATAAMPVAMRHACQIILAHLDGSLVEYRPS